jgi:hypothetical protein
MRLDLGGMLDRALETNIVICPGQARRGREAADGSQSTLLARIRGGGRGTLDEVVGQNGGRWLQCSQMEMRPPWYLAPGAAHDNDAPTHCNHGRPETTGSREARCAGLAVR